VSAVKYELGFYFPEDHILHNHRRGNLKSYIALTVWALQQRRNVSPVKYELSFYIPEDGILHSHRRENTQILVSCYSVEVSRNILKCQHSCDVMFIDSQARGSSRSVRGL
jgi:hypothetical protein